MKKRLLAIVLSFAMVCGNGASVFASEDPVCTETSADQILTDTETSYSECDETDAGTAENAEDKAEEISETSAPSAEETAGEITEEVSEESVEENTEQPADDEISGETAEETTDDLSGESAGEITEEISEQPSADEITEEVSEQPSTDEVTEEISEQPSADEITEEVSEQSSADEITEDVSEQSSADEITEEVSEQPSAESSEAEETIQEEAPAEETDTEEAEKESDDQVSVLASTATWPVIKKLYLQRRLSSLYDYVNITFSDFITGSYDIYTRTSTTGSWSLAEESYECEETLVHSFQYRSVRAGTLYVAVVPSGQNVSSAPSTAMGVLYNPYPIMRFSASAEEKGILLNWFDSYGNDSVNIYRKQTAQDDTSYKKIATVSGSHTTYTDTTASFGVQYTYRVQGVYHNNEVELYSTQNSLWLKGPSIKKISNSGNKVTVSWSKITGATGYNIYLQYYSGNGEYDYYGNNFTIKSANTTSKTFTVESGRKFKIMVKAYKDTTSCGTINSSSGSIIGYIAGNTVLRGSAKTTASTITLKWDKDSNASGYIIYRYNAKTKKFVKIATINSSTATSYTNKKLKANTGYKYKIRPFRKTAKGTLYSPVSNIVTIYTNPTAASIKKANKAKTSVKKIKQLTGVYTEQKIFIDQKGRLNVCYTETSDSKYIIIKRYNSSLKLLKTIKIKKKYPTFGSIACDSSGNLYIAWGQSDTYETKTKKTFAISKYSYSGKFIKTTAFKGKTLNVKTPFHAGDCSIAIKGTTLVCTFARLMYKSDDGLNHQANQVVTLNTKTMKSTDKYYNYASHSFDQQVILLNNGDALFADLGDAYPRSLVLTRSGSSSLGYGSRDVAHFYGVLGNNTTYGELGGIAEVSTGYVLVGIAGKQMTESQWSNKQVFLSITDPSTMQSAITGSKRTGTCEGTATTDTGICWVTNYTDGSIAQNVRSVKLDNDRIFIAWEKYTKSTQYGYDYYNYKQTYYAIYSSTGKRIQKPKALNKIRLNSDTELSYSKGYVYWTATTYTAASSWFETPTDLGYTVYKIKV